MKHDKGRLQPFVPLLIETLDSRAWRAMSHGARSLYVALRRRYGHKIHNNGRVFISHRDAMKEVGSGFEEIGRWFRELQHYGFIFQTQGGCLGLDGKGKAPHWRLTELGYMRDPPTRDFAHWDGTPFKDRRRRPGRDQKQNPATERRCTPLRKGGAPLLRKGGALHGTSATERRCIEGNTTATERRCISRLTTSSALSDDLDDYLAGYPT
jgi:hypothetical protein